MNRRRTIIVEWLLIMKKRINLEMKRFVLSLIHADSHMIQCNLVMMNFQNIDFQKQKMIVSHEIASYDWAWLL
jgi:hypothetical protein